MGADAVVILAGASDGRHQLGAELVHAGVSGNFVVSNPSGFEDHVGSAFCRGAKIPVEANAAWCLIPDPVTTTGEALTVGQLAEQQGWKEIVVVTNRPHTHRVRTMFKDCTDLETSVVNIGEIDWRYFHRSLAREIGGYLKYWVNDPCAAEKAS